MNDILEISADGTTLTKVLDNSITHLTIPNGVSKFNRGVFKECINLESFDIPDALIDIDIVSLLGGCKSLLSINVGEGNRRYKAIDGILYSKDLTKIIFVPRGKKMECFTIPDCVSEIGERAFSRCNSIVSIVIPNTVISIGRDAFANCESLQTINIPDYITEIDAFLDGRTSIHFRGCSSLHSIFIPENVTEIDEYAFSRCTSLQEIIVHKRNRNYTSIDGILYSKDLSKIIIVPIGKEVKQFTVPKEVKQISGFQHCISLEEIIISQNVERIESYTFSGCISLQKVTISGNVSEIKMCTFEDCKSLHDITLSDGIKCIGQAAFRNCISLQNIYIPNSVKKISRNAFDGCTSLNTIKVGDENPVFSSTQGILYSKDLKKILRVPQNAKLENFTIPEGVTEIGDCAFDGCDSLHYIDIPNTVIKIGEFAFYGCDGLSSITIPKGMLSIGCSAFEYCLSLSIIKIPDSVEDIGDNAFEGCEKLKEVHIPMTISKIGDDAFKGTEWYKGIESENTDFVTINNILIKYKGDKNCVDLSIPFGIKVIGHNLFKGCTELKNVDIPNSVTTIGKSAFYGCI